MAKEKKCPKMVSNALSPSAQINPLTPIPLPLKCEEQNALIQGLIKKTYIVDTTII